MTLPLSPHAREAVERLDNARRTRRRIATHQALLARLQQELRAARRQAHLDAAATNSRDYTHAILAVLPTDRDDAMTAHELAAIVGCVPKTVIDRAAWWSLTT